MLPNEHQMTAPTPLRDRMRSADLRSSLPTDLPVVFARRAADLTARARLGESTPDAVLLPYQCRQTGRLAVYVWRARPVRRREVVIQRLGEACPEGAGR